MAHTLTVRFGISSVKVNGVAVTSTYTLKDKDVIVATAIPRPGVGIAIIVAHKDGSGKYTGTGNQIDLADTDIELFVAMAVGGSDESAILTINYSESGGGSILDVTYNSKKIIDSIEVTPPVEVTYNGSTIATLNAGDTKTLQCSGKVMSSDVVIGDKTLKCNGKLMTSDVIVDVSGGGQPRS